MPKEVLSITIDDVSLFTKTLRNALKKHDGLPGHATMLGLVAKAADYDNFQHLKAAKPQAIAMRDSKQLIRALRVFQNGMMTRWPKQTSVQALCMWVFWAALPAHRDMTEGTVNDILIARHSFGDHALLRRSLIDHKLVTRTADGRTYRRIEQAPPDDAKRLIADQRPS